MKTPIVRKLAKLCDDYEEKYGHLPDVIRLGHKDCEAYCEWLKHKSSLYGYPPKSSRTLLFRGVQVVEGSEFIRKVV